MKLLKYLKKQIIHKYYIFEYGIKFGISFKQMLLHDLSKFSYTEIKGYLYNKGNDDLYYAAWNNHLKRNKHHSEYWIIPNKKNPKEIMVLDMPEKYVREMIVDWHSAGMAYAGKDDVDEWLVDNHNKFNMSDNTKKILVKVLIEIEKPNLAQYFSENKKKNL